jgi:hypothetical protein
LLIQAKHAERVLITRRPSKKRGEILSMRKIQTPAGGRLNMRKRFMAGNIIGVLPFITLLLCVADAIPSERVNSVDKRNRVLGSVSAAALRPAAQITGDGLIAFSADNQIYIMNADGSDVRLLTDGTPNRAARRFTSLMSLVAEKRT